MKVRNLRDAAAELPESAECFSAIAVIEVLCVNQRAVFASNQREHLATALMPSLFTCGLCVFSRC